MKKKLLISALLGASALLYSCGSGGGDSVSDLPTNDPTLVSTSIYATVSGQLQSQGISAQAVQIGGYNIAYISAVALENGQLITVSAPVNSDGSFSLTLIKDKEYVFTLFDENGTPLMATIGKAVRVLEDANINVLISETGMDIEVENPESVDIVESADYEDSDGDKLPDAIENVDSDGDGTPDLEEYHKDRDRDGKIDTAEDENENGIPDVIEDNDRDGRPDILEDEDGDHIPDGIEHVARGGNQGTDNRGNMENGHNPNDDRAGNANMEGNNHPEGNDQQHENNNQQHNNQENMDNNRQDQQEHNIPDVKNIAPQDLSEEEIQALKFMWNEEKLAKDLYYTLYEAFQEERQAQVLYNIAYMSEERHQEVVEDLLEKYQISIDDQPYDPERDLDSEYPRGMFSDTDIQTLYDSLLAEGQTSLEDALKVGCKVEVIDVEDLNNRLQQTDNEDIKLAFEFLRSGSYTHYWAFDRALKELGVEDGCCSLGEEFCKTPDEFPMPENGQGPQSTSN